jgi:hypothetical protein
MKGTSKGGNSIFHYWTLDIRISFPGIPDCVIIEEKLQYRHTGA